MGRQVSKGKEYKQHPLGMRLLDSLMRVFVEVIPNTPMPQWWHEEIVELSSDIETMAQEHRTQGATIKSMQSNLTMYKMRLGIEESSKRLPYVKPSVEEETPARVCKLCRAQIRHTNFYMKGLCFSCTPDGLQTLRYKEWQKREERLRNVSNK